MFPGDKAARATRWLPPSPSSVTEFKEKVEIYIYAPSMPSWQVTEKTFIPLTCRLVQLFLHVIKCVSGYNGNKMNNRSVEVNARLIMANRACYGLQNHMKSRNISRNFKTLLYKTLIRPVLTYGAETWVLS